MPTFVPERKCQESEQMVVEVVRIKLSSSIHTKRADQKHVVGHIEADYGRAIKNQTNENKLQSGARCLLVFVGLLCNYFGTPSRPRKDLLFT